MEKKKARKRRKRKVRSFRQKKWRQLRLELLLSMFISSLFFTLGAFFLFAFPIVQGYGMSGILENKDRLVVYKFGDIERFSLVYLNVPNKPKEKSIRRVIGLPGEEITYKNDQLFVNGQEKVERYLTEKVYRAKQEEYLFTEDFTMRKLAKTNVSRIPQGKYFVLGDNRPYVSDSRYYGFIDQEDIIGVVKMRLFPLHEMTNF
ncbi:signal peptidase I [Candidatus Enterococcus mansonii]|uniref:Signal peptidase I n=1 Tax=Candidatus Enterococcus mansonii TaxID=1834181 RepID=A0A242CFC9_9ENTE|nr:signal peptidase I [Enterococcus sp. 4G2_DIV0659]OTO08945.1 signal peptidase I [Enterococcus sp. 4G2_DIV0659]